MPYFITIQYPYDHLTITLSDATKIIQSMSIDKFKAVADLVPTLESILVENQLTLKDISCIGVNTGPGPFNTLRSIIATINAIAYATNIQLVGCNGLDLMLEDSTDTSLVILDAFGSDIYYGVSKSLTKQLPENVGLQNQGYTSIQELVAQLNKIQLSTPLTCIGNGLIKYQTYISQNYNGITEYKTDKLFATKESLVLATRNQFSDKKTQLQLFPLYFESPVVKEA